MHNRQICLRETSLLFHVAFVVLSDAVGIAHWLKWLLIAF
jgi:hypothetical protein